MRSEELEQWLLALPLSEPCEIDGERVYFNIFDDGAELGLILLAQPSDAQVTEAIRTGFQGAMEFEAGLGIGEDGALLLNRWLPQAETWFDAADALEDLLNQAGLWRAALGYVTKTGNRRDTGINRAEQRLRAAIKGDTP
ncbi:hypothetical protein [Herbaspirillum sp. alder98]|uniref:hypothetical protein n=1 Tax=Herbaspirillum sp. alder98 TaxID=2913096 RepID=UPI001CD83EBB|nr:hypothetical protein [Herbaspirillum sp. alder98]MCA1325649.1 hypothetical protein [Herbaspirillum sp. alder98]